MSDKYSIYYVHPDDEECDKSIYLQLYSHLDVLQNCR